MAHPLKIYRVVNDQTLADFAALVGSSAASVCEWENYKKFPRTDTLMKIQEITKGKITANDFVPPPASAQ